MYTITAVSHLLLLQPTVGIHKQLISPLLLPRPGEIKKKYLQVIQ